MGPRSKNPRYLTLRRVAVAVLIALLAVMPVQAAGADGDIEALLNSGLAHRDKGNFAAAEADFRAVIDAEPEHHDARLLLALVIGYQERFDEALAILGPALEAEPGRSDLLLARARLNAWAGRPAAARADLDKALAGDPDDAAALELSAWLDRVGEEAAPSYVLSLTGSRSDFDRRSVDRWYETRMGLGYQVPGHWSVDGVLQRSRRYGSFDHLLELGGSMRAGEGGALSLRAETSPGADFLPRWGVSGGIELDAWDGMPALGLGPGIATLGARHREYADVGVDNLDPGWIQYLGDGSAWITARRIHAWSDDGGGTMTGWSLRGDLSFDPVAPVNVYALRAKSPETDLGVTVDTRTWAAGMVVGVSEKVDVRLDFTRDDRSGSYLRDEWSLGTAVRF
ncbi:MAG: YaiO family outer membrane beta-barrel protein [Rhodospirillales bacterium]